MQKRVVKKIRGISPVIATILLILITVVVMGIIWLALQPFLSEKTSGFATCDKVDIMLDAQSGVSCYDSGKDIVAVEVKKGSNNINITKLQFIFSYAGSEKSNMQEAVFDFNTQKVFYFNMTNINTGEKPDKISVIAIIRVDATEKICDANTVEVPLKECSLPDSATNSAKIASDGWGCSDDGDCDATKKLYCYKPAGRKTGACCLNRTCSGAGASGIPAGSSGGGNPSSPIIAPPIVCSDGLSACNGVCVNTSLDNNNCGGCGSICDGSYLLLWSYECSTSGCCVDVPILGLKCKGIVESCTDRIQNQDETDVDCGGSVCSACPTCSDGVQNQDETGVDCGGVCGGVCYGEPGCQAYCRPETQPCGFDIKSLAECADCTGERLTGTFCGSTEICVEGRCEPNPSCNTFCYSYDYNMRFDFPCEMRYLEYIDPTWTACQDCPEINELLAIYGAYCDVGTCNENTHNCECTPDCVGKPIGADDGCGGICEPCVPDCVGKTGGASDGCGNFCNCTIYGCPTNVEGPLCYQESSPLYGTVESIVSNFSRLSGGSPNCVLSNNGLGWDYYLYRPVPFSTGYLDLPNFADNKWYSAPPAQYSIPRDINQLISYSQIHLISGYGFPNDLRNSLSYNEWAKNAKSAKWRVRINVTFSSTTQLPIHPIPASGLDLFDNSLHSLDREVEIPEYCYYNSSENRYFPYLIVGLAFFRDGGTSFGNYSLACADYNRGTVRPIPTGNLLTQQDFIESGGLPYIHVDFYEEAMIWNITGNITTNCGPTSTASKSCVGLLSPSTGPWAVCGNDFVNIWADNNNCGRCGLVCPRSPMGSAYCRSGMCSTT